MKHIYTISVINLLVFLLGNFFIFFIFYINDWFAYYELYRLGYSLVMQ